MVVVVVENVANRLVEHREECSKCAQTCVIHNVFQLLTVLKTLAHKSVGYKEWLQNGGAITLELST